MQLNENRVRERAYQIWEAEGKPMGCADQHWNLACQYEAEQANSEQGEDSYNTLGQEESGMDTNLPTEEHEVHHKKKSKHPRNRH